MSVVVRGMKMPESCGTCFVGNRTICKNGCPLVDLGKHGRLIDADELAETAEFYETVMDIGHHAQTVIEAEDSE